MEKYEIVGKIQQKKKKPHQKGLDAYFVWGKDQPFCSHYIPCYGEDPPSRNCSARLSVLPASQ